MLINRYIESDMKINIPFEKKNQLKDFINSEVFSDRCIKSYSEYWSEHAARMSLGFSGDGVEVSGDSGFYIPEATFKRFFRRLVKAFKSPKIGFTKALDLFQQHFSSRQYMTWAEGFVATMRHDPLTDPDLSPYRINHLNLKRDFSDTLVSIEDIKRHYGQWAPYSLSDHIIIAYYFRNILIPYLNRHKSLNFMEIGGGGGNLASILYREYSPNTFLMVDLPESIVNAFVFLSNVFPEARIILPNAFEEFITSFDLENTSNGDVGIFVFLTPWQINALPKNIVDLSINTHSFQEMTHSQISDYFNLVERVSKNEGLFFCVNRVEKIPCNANAYTEVQNEPPNRFYEYPWREKNIRLIDEVSRLHRVCSADGTAIKLEKIVKSV